MKLFTPGPTPVPEFVRMAMATPTIHHRTPEFEAIFQKTREMLIALYGMEEAIMLCSSGSGAMEAALINLCKKESLNVNAGKFGERFGKIAKAHGIKNTELKYEWDTPVSVEDVVNAVKNNSEIDTICIQISESAGGLRHPVERVAAAVKAINPNIAVIADGITAFGVEQIDVTNIDALIGGSQKAFMLPPGLAFIGLSALAVKRIEESSRGFYFNLATELKNQRKNTTAWTAATTLTIGLGAILEEFFAMGVENLYRQTHARAEATRESLKALGLKIYPKTPADSMTTVIDENAEKIRKTLKNDLNVNIAGGQDDLKGKIFRINHMGLIDVSDALWAVNAVEIAMERIGMRKFDGEANRIFVQKYYEVLK